MDFGLDELSFGDDDDDVSADAKGGSPFSSALSSDGAQPSNEIAKALQEYNKDKARRGGEDEDEDDENDEYDISDDGLLAKVAANTPSYRLKQV